MERSGRKEMTLSMSSRRSMKSPSVATDAKKERNSPRTCRRRSQRGEGHSTSETPQKDKSMLNSSFLSVPSSNIESECSDLDNSHDHSESLRQIANSITAKLKADAESDESEILPDMNSPRKHHSPKKRDCQSSLPSTPVSKRSSERKVRVVSQAKESPVTCKTSTHDDSVSMESSCLSPHVTRYTVPELRTPAPLDYDPVDFNECQPLGYAEETKSDDVQLVLIGVPFGFDVSSLDKKTLQMDEVVKDEKDGLVWRSHSTKLEKNDEIQDFVPLLPSKKTGHLVAVKPFSHHLTFSAEYKIPVLPEPVIPPEPDFEIPKGLKYRNQPFGCRDVDDVKEKSLQSSQRSHQHRKRKHRESDVSERELQSPQQSPQHRKRKRRDSHVPGDDTKKKKKKKKKH